MKIAVVPGSFKSTLRSIEAVRQIESCVRALCPKAEVESRVIADGGEGTLEMFETHFGAARQFIEVRDPLGRYVTGSACHLGSDSLVIESCQAVGISMLKAHELDPMRATSCGVADFLRWAQLNGKRHVFITMGDSAIMDLGVGMLDSLGVKFFDAHGIAFRPSLATLSAITSFDDSSLDVLRDGMTVTCLVDTDDFLSGPDGQVQLYGAQKGLQAHQINDVERAYGAFCGLVHREKGIDLLTQPRATGSGGLAAACLAFLGSRLHNTLEYVDESLGLSRLLGSSDLVLTGEGCLDNQSKYGKVPYFVAQRSTGNVLCLVGRYTDEGADDLLQVNSRCEIHCMDPAYAIVNAPEALRELAEQVLSRLPTEDGARSEAAV